MSTIYGIQKPPESRDERPFIIARNSKERGRCQSEKFFACVLQSAFIGARASEFLFEM